MHIYVFNETPNTGIAGCHRSKGLDKVDRLYIKNQRTNDVIWHKSLIEMYWFKYCFHMVLCVCEW